MSSLDIFNNRSDAYNIIHFIALGAFVMLNLASEFKAAVEFFFSNILHWGIVNIAIWNIARIVAMVSNFTRVEHHPEKIKHKLPCLNKYRKDFNETHKFIPCGFLGVVGVLAPITSIISLDMFMVNNGEVL